MATKAAAKPAAKAAPKKPGNAVAIKKPSGGALVSIKEQMAAELAALGDRTAPASGDKISTKGKKFTLPNGDTPDVLQAVIVDFVSYNAFYEGAYNKDAIVPPTCFALGTVPIKMAPPDSVPVKQNDDCATCTMNAFGSDGNGKACKNHRRLALLPPGGDANDPLWILDVSPTGIKAFDAYVKSVATKFHVTPIGVVTELYFDEALDYPSLRFRDPQPNESMAEHWERREEAMERLLQEPDTSGYAAPAPPKSKGRTAAKPAARR